MKKISIILLFHCIYFFQSIAQDSIAMIHIQNLCSSKMNGRGYVNNGVGIAANYIDSCFASKNLSYLPKLKSYKQPLSYSVNTFPSLMNISIGNIELEAGKDFILEPHSKGIKGTFECVTITKEDLFVGKKLPPLDGKILIVDDRNPISIEKKDLDKINSSLYYTSIAKSNIAGIIELTNQKLTWSTSDFEGSCAYIKINSQKELPKKINSITLDIKNEFIKKYKTDNICGYIKGYENQDSLIVITAHYDHLGMLGNKVYFPGANDNASGVASMLHLLDYFSTNKPKYSIVFIAFTGEEIGLKGSTFFADNPAIELQKIRFLINLDLAGTGDEGIQIVNSTVFSKEANLMIELNDSLQLLPQIKKRGEACNSDHCPIYSKGVPSFFIYTLGGIAAYHDIYDIPETLPLTEFNDYMKLLELFITEL